jgi:hypothetical protein
MDAPHLADISLLKTSINVSLFSQRYRSKDLKESG